MSILKIKWKRLVARSLGALMTITLGVCLCYSLMSPLGRWDVTPTLWRKYVANDIVAGGLLVGLSRDEIINKLGSPTYRNNDRLEWWIGKEKSDSLMFASDIYLVARFRDGKCESVLLASRD